MTNITLEVPYVLVDVSKLRKSYSDPFGNTFNLNTYGSYICDCNGGRLVFGEDDFDGGLMTFRGGMTIGEVMQEGKDGCRKRSQDLIKSRIRRINGKGIPFLATMTSTKKSNKDNMEEVYGLLDYLADGIDGNGVILAHPMIAKDIMRRYGKNLVYISSVIRHISFPCQYDTLFRKYDYVVIKPEDVLTLDGELNESFFLGIGPDRRKRSIVMANLICQRDCVSAKEHFLRMSEKAKSYHLYSGIDAERWRCDHNKELELDGDDVGSLIDLGVTHIKIGRNHNSISKSLELLPFLDIYRYDQNLELIE